jgi:hypothetical protein
MKRAIFVILIALSLSTSAFAAKVPENLPKAQKLGLFYKALCDVMGGSYGPDEVLQQVTHVQYWHCVGGDWCIVLPDSKFCQ